jgi:hypothetical protein
MRSAGIELCPMTGWRAVRLPGRNVMVELEYVESLEEYRRGPQHVLQLAMTIERAAELIKTVQQAMAATPSRQITASARANTLTPESASHRQPKRSDSPGPTSIVVKPST